MIELEKHIEILLLSNDCVIVPGFGGFMAHHADARFDERDNTFIPPLRTIGFNPKLKMNDSLLAQSYVEAYDISYPEALRRIADETREISERIESDGMFELHNIGTIFLNEDGHYNFEPCEAGILTPELYGLGSFDLKPLSNASCDNDNSAKATIVSMGSEDNGANEKTISIKVSILRNIAVACIAIIAFVLLPEPLGTPSVSTAGRTIDTRMLDKIMPKEITTGTSSIQNIDIKNLQRPAAKETPEKKEKLSCERLSDTDCYVIVLASKVAKKNAEEYVRHLKEQGYAEARVLTRNNNTKVVYGRYTSRNEAYSKLAQLDVEDGWVMKVD